MQAAVRSCSSRAPEIIPDKTNSTLTIEDSGIGMTKNDPRPSANRRLLQTSRRDGIGYGKILGRGSLSSVLCSLLRPVDTTSWHETAEEAVEASSARGMPSPFGKHKLQVVARSLSSSPPLRLQKQGECKRILRS